MSIKSQVLLLKQSAKEDNFCERWNQWRMKNPTETIDLSYTILAKMNLVGINLCGAILTSTAFIDSKLFYANFRGAKFNAAHLGNANLNGANLRGANLHNTNLRNTDLRQSTLRYAIFDKTIVINAIADAQTFVGVEPNHLIGIESVRYLDTDALATPTIIANKPIFISYSRKAEVPRLPQYHGQDALPVASGVTMALDNHDHCSSLLIYKG